MRGVNVVRQQTAVHTAEWPEPEPIGSEVRIVSENRKESRSGSFAVAVGLTKSGVRSLCRSGTVAVVAGLTKSGGRSLCRSGTVVVVAGLTKSEGRSILDQVLLLL